MVDTSVVKWLHNTVDYLNSWECKPAIICCLTRNVSELKMCNNIHGGAVAQSVERTTPGEEVLGSITAVAAPPPPPAPYWLVWCQYNVTGWDRSHGLPALSHVWQHVKFSDVSLGTRPRYNLVTDEDV